MRKTRLIHKIEALERYCRSLEKANQVGISGGEVLYMDKEKARLIEELLKRDRLVASLSELVRQLQTENETLGEQLEELAKAKQAVEKPAKDSKTSSQPPTQDQKKNIKNECRWGAKAGHKGYYYQELPPDEVKRVVVHTCPFTGEDISHQPVVKFITHQVVSIECKRKVTNYELEVRFSPAYGGLVSAPLPNGGKHYDNSIRSLSAYLNTVHHIPQGRCRQILQDLFSVAPAKGTINNILIRPPQLCKAIFQSLKHCIRISPVVGADETGYRVEGKDGICGAFNRINSVYSLLLTPAPVQ